MCVGQTSEPAKMAEPIEILFRGGKGGGQTNMGPRNHVLDGVDIGTTLLIQLSDQNWWRYGLWLLIITSATYLLCNCHHR